MVGQETADYVRGCLVRGKTKEELYKELLDQGLSIEDIQGAFSALSVEREKEDTAKRTIRIIVTIGAILVGAGIFSFVAANWQGMSKTVKVGVILVSMLTSYGLGWQVKEKLGLEKTGSALFLLGTIIYGAGIFLVAQTFHTLVNWPDSFILWMLGTMAMAFALESDAHFYLAVFLGVVAVVGHLIGVFTGHRHEQILLASPFLLLVAMFVTFAAGMMFKKRVPPELREFY